MCYNDDNILILFVDFLFNVATAIALTLYLPATAFMTETFMLFYQDFINQISFVLVMKGAEDLAMAIQEVLW